METTAIFVFSKECPACIQYKMQYYSSIIKYCKAEKIRIREYTANSLVGFGDGYAMTPTNMKFLEHVNFYPCIMAVSTFLLEQYERGEASVDDVLSKLLIFNGAVVSGNVPKRIRTVQPYTYGLSPQEFAKFINSYSKREVVEVKPERKVSEPINIHSQKYITSKMNSCGGINAFSINKR